jgi:hypothetical protein
MVLAGPALYLLGESLFRWRMTGTPDARRLVAAALLIGLVPVGSAVSALALSVIVALLLSVLAALELRSAPLRRPRPVLTAEAS